MWVTWVCMTKADRSAYNGRLRWLHKRRDRCLIFVFAFAYSLKAVKTIFVVKAVKAEDTVKEFEGEWWRPQ